MLFGEGKFLISFRKVLFGFVMVLGIERGNYGEEYKGKFYYKD